MIKFFSEMVIAVLLGSLVQNVILSGGYGVSEAVRVAGRGKQRFIMTGLVGCFTLSSAVIARALDFIPSIVDLGTLWHYALYFFIIVILYGLVCIVLFSTKKATKALLSVLGVAAFNSLVLAVPIINRSAGASMAESIGMALGATLAFFITVQLLHSGLHKIMHNEDIPESFKTTPAIFIYIGLMALAFMGFAGQSLFV